MKKLNINLTSLIVTVIALVALVFLLIHSRREMIATSVPSGTATTPTNVCYFLNKPAVSGEGNDLAYVRLTIGGSSTVTGKLGVQFAGKDSEIGALSGTVSPGTQIGQYIFDGTYNSNSEGMNTSAQEHITLDGSSAQLDYYGVTLSIPHVDCSQYPGLV